MIFKFCLLPPTLARPKRHPFVSTKRIVTFRDSPPRCDGGRPRALEFEMAVNNPHPHHFRIANRPAPERWPDAVVRQGSSGEQQALFGGSLLRTSGREVSSKSFGWRVFSEQPSHEATRPALCASPVKIVFLERRLEALSKPVPAVSPAAVLRQSTAFEAMKLKLLHCFSEKLLCLLYHTEMPREREKPKWSIIIDNYWTKWL